jgi:hypothetical protein
LNRQDAKDAKKSLSFMDDLIKALESSVANKNWYGSLFVALSVPDICGYLESPTERSQARYERWFERYMLSSYSSHIGPEKTPHTFLSPSDCYALRCALLHEGREEITEQRAREVLDRFHFIEPPPLGSRIHCNQINNVLQLQVDIFCNDILDGLRKWVQDVQDVPEVRKCIGSVLKVYPFNQIPGIFRGK